MSELAAVCRTILSQIEGAQACALLELPTGARLGEAVTRGAQPVTPEAARAVERLLGREGLLARVAGASAGFEEAHLVVGGLDHFAKLLGGGRAALLLATSEARSLGRVWAQVKKAAAALEAHLAAPGC